MNCENCGSPLQAGAKFCASCGHAVDPATAADALTQVMPAAVPAARQIQPTSPSGAMESGASQQTPPTDAAAARHRRNWAIAVAVLVALVAAGALAYLLLSGGNEYEEQLADVMAPVVESNRAFNEAARAAEGGGSTAPLVEAAGEAAADARRALLETEQIPGGTADQMAIVREGLERETTYAKLVADRGNWSANQLEAAGEEAENAGARLAGIVPEFQPLVVQPVVAAAERAEERSTVRKQELQFATEMEAAVSESQDTYADFAGLDGEVANGLTTVAKATDEIGGVIGGRQDAIATGSSISPSGDEAADIKALFIEAAQALLRQDEQFKLALTDYTPADGDETNYLKSSWATAYDANNGAERRRTEFFDAFNEYRESLGLDPSAYDSF